MAMAYAIEGEVCGPVDCDDTNAAVNPGVAEVCDDIIDNDCDGTSDCGNDPDCDTDLVCRPPCAPVKEICDDGIDNDGNGKTDCFDRYCREDPACSPPPEICNDGIDNDGDGKTDCADNKDCRKDPSC